MLSFVPFTLIVIVFEVLVYVQVPFVTLISDGNGAHVGIINQALSLSKLIELVSLELNVTQVLFVISKNVLSE